MLFKYLSQQPRLFFFAFLFLLLVDTVQLFIPKVIKTAIDGLKVGSINSTNLVTYGLYLLGLAICVWIFRATWRWMLLQGASRVTTNLRANFYNKLLYFSQEYFAKWDTGDLMARATNDLNAVRSMLSFGFVSIFDAIFMGSASLCFMLFINFKLSLLVLIPLPLLIPVVLYFEGKIHKTYAKVQEKFSDLTTLVQEIFTGIFVVKAFSLEKIKTQRFEQQNNDYVKHNLKLAKLGALFDPFLTLPTAISVVLALYFGGMQIAQGTMSVGELVAFIAYLDMLSWPVMALGFSVNIYQRGTASVKRLEEITEQIIDNEETKGSIILDNLKPLEIEFRNVNFSYNNDDVCILNNFNLHIPAGQKLGIIGRIGSGKSTLLKLILRLRYVNSGELVVNNSNINNYELNSLREEISCVPQEPFLFSTTIADNIAFFAPNSSPDKIMKAAALACIDSSIQTIPQKYQSLLGEKGVNLSGGQKQRLTLARALIRQTSCYIFDDCFSAIDTETEDLILTNLEAVIKSSTAIFITHRVSTLRHVDRIVVLEQGNIVEDGTHLELLELNGIYADIVKRQQLEDKLASK